MTHNFSDFNSITLTLGDIKLKLLTGKLAKSMSAPGGLLPVPRNPHWCLCWVLSIHFQGQNLKHSVMAHPREAAKPPPSAGRNHVDIHSRNPEARRFWKRQSGRMRPPGLSPQRAHTAHCSRASSSGHRVRPKEWNALSPMCPFPLLSRLRSV